MNAISGGGGVGWEGRIGKGKIGKFGGKQNVGIIQIPLRELLTALRVSAVDVARI